MTVTAVRDATEGDFDRIVELNAAVVRETSAMDLARLRQLHALAFHHRVAIVDGEVAGFLLAMRDGAAYINDNFDWFSARYPRFVYVDRIVVAAAAAGTGIGRRLYDDLFDRARQLCIGIIACEYNLEPPNPASRRFHDRFGFREVGRQHVADGTKLVSLQIAEVPDSDAR
jgi:uncharacterized protein